MDTYLRTVENNYTAPAPKVWCDNFKIYSLTEIMHQKEEKKFCEMLNCLCKVQCTEEDNRVFESRIVRKDSPEYKYNTRHIFPFANAVKAHNNNIFHQIQEDKVTIQAEDVVCGNPKEGERDRAYYNLLIKDD